jgi:prepilin peptidase CpaA
MSSVVTALRDPFLVTGWLACAVAVVGAATDLWRGKVYNVLTYPACVVGLVLGLTYFGWKGLGLSALGLALAFVPSFALFAMGGLGGGDVKLFAALGALLGATQGIAILLLSFVVGGIFSIFALVKRGTFLSSTGRMFRSIAASVVPGVKRPESVPLTEMRFAPSIAIATLLVVTGVADQMLEMMR